MRHTGSANPSHHPPCPSNKNDLPTVRVSSSVPNVLQTTMHDKTGKAVLCQLSEPTTVTERSGNFSSATTCHYRRRTNYSGDVKATAALEACSSPPPKPETPLPKPNHATSHTPGPLFVAPRYEMNHPKSRPVARDHRLI